jgi:hypothetical protein
MPLWKWLAIIGTVVQAAGVGMLFKWGFPQPQLAEDERAGDFLVTEGPVNLEERRRDLLTTKRWKRLSMTALALIMVGYSLQLWAVVEAP